MPDQAAARPVAAVGRRPGPSSRISIRSWSGSQRQAHERRRLPGVAERVGQRLLDDAVDRRRRGWPAAAAARRRPRARPAARPRGPGRRARRSGRSPGCGATPAPSPSSSSDAQQPPELGHRLAPGRLDRRAATPRPAPATGATTCRAAPAWMTITLTACATTSCSSRAMRRALLGHGRRGGAPRASRRARSTPRLARSASTRRCADEVAQRARSGPGRRTAGRAPGGRRRPGRGTPSAITPATISTTSADRGSGPRSIAGGVAGQRDRADLDPRRRRLRARQAPRGRRRASEDGDRPEPPDEQRQDDEQEPPGSRSRSPVPARQVDRGRRRPMPSDRPRRPSGRAAIAARRLHPAVHRPTVVAAAADGHPTGGRRRLIRTVETRRDAHRRWGRGPRPAADDSGPPACQQPEASDDPSTHGGPRWQPLITLRGVTKRYPGSTRSPPSTRSTSTSSRAHHRDHGPVGLRQVDAAQPDRRPRPADAGRDRGRRASGSTD